MFTDQIMKYGEPAKRVGYNIRLHKMHDVETFFQESSDHECLSIRNAGLGLTIEISYHPYIVPR